MLGKLAAACCIQPCLALGPLRSPVLDAAASSAGAALHASRCPRTISLADSLRCKAGPVGLALPCVQALWEGSVQSWGHMLCESF